MRKDRLSKNDCYLFFDSTKKNKRRKWNLKKEHEKEDLGRERKKAEQKEERWRRQKDECSEDEEGQARNSTKKTEETVDEFYWSIGCPLL